MDSVTITTTLDGRALQRGLSRLPALRAPEEAWCELAEGLRGLDADQLIAAAEAAHICEYLRESRSRRPKQALVFWACGELLDAASWIDRPPGYEYLGYGSLRRQAQDAGGVEGQALMELARAVLALSQGGAGTVSGDGGPQPAHHRLYLRVLRDRG